MTQRYVGLVRVSTERQGESRLGLEAGLADIHRFLQGQGEAELVKVFEEVESGGHDLLIDRPTLLRALTLCKRTGATLLVPKVDRLVRSTQVHTDIKRSRVPFRACDNPHANEFTLDILVAVAAQERRAISERVKAALAIYKRDKRVSKATLLRYPEGIPASVREARGGLLGANLVGCHLTDHDRDKGRRKGNLKQAREALEVYDDLVDEMKGWREGGMSLQVIAARLNDEGHSTRTGAKWGPVQVKRVLDRTCNGSYMNE